MTAVCRATSWTSWRCSATCSPTILQFVAGAPPLPVQRYAREFTQFVFAITTRAVGVWSAYPDITVIDILSGARGL